MPRKHIPDSTNEVTNYNTLDNGHGQCQRRVEGGYGRNVWPPSWPVLAPRQTTKPQTTPTLRYTHFKGARTCVSLPSHCTCMRLIPSTLLSHMHVDTCARAHVCTVHVCAHKCTHTNTHMHAMHTYPSTSMRMGHFITTSPEINHTHSEINHTHPQTNHTLTAPTLKLTIPTHWTMPVTYGISLDIHT